MILYKHTPDKSLKALLTKIHGIKTIVDKTRRIYFVENVKFHFDRVKDLGVFLEVEAIDTSGKMGVEKLKKQCDEYFKFFGLVNHNFIDKSYSDLIIEKQIIE